MKRIFRGMKKLEIILELSFKSIIGRAKCFEKLERLEEARNERH